MGEKVKKAEGEAGNVNHVNHQPPREQGGSDEHGAVSDGTDETAHGQQGPQAAIPDSAETAPGEGQHHEDGEEHASRDGERDIEQPYEHERDERRNPALSHRMAKVPCLSGAGT